MFKKIEAFSFGEKKTKTPSIGVGVVLDLYTGDRYTGKCVSIKDLKYHLSD